MHPVLSGALIEENAYVATDAYKVVVLNRPKNDGLETGKIYNPNFKCTNIRGCKKEEYYVDTDQKFPEYKKVFPTFSYVSEWLPIEPIFTHLNSGYLIVKKLNEIGYQKYNAFEISTNVGKVIANIKYLVETFQVFRANGDKEFRLKFSESIENKGFLLETKSGNYALGMPIMPEPLRMQIAPLEVSVTKINKEKNKPEETQKKESKKIEIIPPYPSLTEFNEENPDYESLEKELGNIMGKKFEDWKKEVISKNREEKFAIYSKEIKDKIEAQKGEKEGVYISDYEPEKKGFEYVIKQTGKSKYNVNLSLHQYGYFSAYPTAIQDFKSLKECGDFIIKTLKESKRFYYTNMLGLSQLQNKINEIKGYQY
ncbi:MAG: hypothetical protein Q3983_10260, partial [Capnocytophaga sp.]|nr:hypothetical protein [Capnocytophaga sp.]